MNTQAIYKKIVSLDKKLKHLLCEIQSHDTVQTTGNNIVFSSPYIYNTFSSPTTGDLTNTLTNAKLGVIQKIYHEDSSEPTFPVGWVRIGEGEYVVNELNIIYAEWVSGTRVEYWINQEA